MKEELFLTSHDQKVDLGVSIYYPENPIATIQFTHGMAAHHKIYEDIFDNLVAHNYAVIASDNRGHGDSTNANYPLGYMDKYENIVADQLTVWQYMHDLYPHLPHYSLSHSFGTMIIRVLMQDYDDLFDKVIFTGAPHYFMGIPLMSKFLSAVVTSSHNEYFMPKKLMDTFNHNFRKYVHYFPNEEAKKKYREDDKIVDVYTTRGIQVILDMMIQFNKRDAYQVKNPNLAIVSMTGLEDFWIGRLKNIRGAMFVLRDVGYNNITMGLYPNMKHELFFEKHEYNIISHDLLRFLKA